MVFVENFSQKTSENNSQRGFFFSFYVTLRGPPFY